MSKLGDTSVYPLSSISDTSKVPFTDGEVVKNIQYSALKTSLQTFLQGAGQAGYVAVTASRDVAVTDRGKVLVCSGSGITLTVPAGFTADTTFYCTVVNINAAGGATVALATSAPFTGSATISAQGAGYWVETSATAFQFLPLAVTPGLTIGRADLPLNQASISASTFFSLAATAGTLEFKNTTMNSTLDLSTGLPAGTIEGKATLIINRSSTYTLSVSAGFLTGDGTLKANQAGIVIASATASNLVFINLGEPAVQEAVFRDTTLSSTVGASANVSFFFASRHILTLTANTAISFTNLVANTGQSLIVKIKQDGTGGRVPTWAVSGGNVYWEGGTTTPPAGSTAANAIDYYVFVSDDGVNVHGALAIKGS